MNKLSIKNLILDYNGVISNDFELVYKTSMKIFEKYGLDAISLKEFKKRFKIPAINFWKEVLPQVNFDELNQFYFETYKTLGNPKPYDKVKETLEKLATKGIKLVILSSHKKENIISEIKTFRVNPNIFEAIYSDIQDKTAVITQIIKDHKFKPTETAYIGDTEHDIQTAKSVCVTSIASTYGYRTREQLMKVFPDFFVDSISELEFI